MGSPVDRLPAQCPRALFEGLEQLADRARRGESVEVPHLTLFVGGGHAITGRFVAFHHDQREGGSVALHATQTQFALDVVYITLETISAVMVHHRESTIAGLSGGKVAPKPKEIPGKLVLDRQVAAMLERTGPLEIDWAGLGNTDESRAALALLFEVLPGIITELRADQFGADAWKAKIDRVVVTSGNGTIAVRDRALRIELERKGSEVFAPTARTLKQAIEAEL
jgi:hypothetical protein